MLGKLIGKIAAAPVRILDLPNKVIKAIVSDDDDETTCDRIAKAMEKQAEKIIGD